MLGAGGGGGKGGRIFIPKMLMINIFVTVKHIISREFVFTIHKHHMAHVGFTIVNRPPEVWYKVSHNNLTPSLPPPGLGNTFTRGHKRKTRNRPQSL